MLTSGARRGARRRMTTDAKKLFVSYTSDRRSVIGRLDGSRLCALRNGIMFATGSLGMIVGAPRFKIARPTEGLEDDWRKVGEDLRRAIATYEREAGRKEPDSGKLPRHEEKIDKSTEKRRANERT